MPPRKPLQFPPRPPVDYGRAGEAISLLKLRLKPVRIGPIPGGSCAANRKAPVRKPDPRMANLVYRRQFTVEWGHCDPAGIVFNSRFFEYFDWSAWQLFEAA